MRRLVFCLLVSSVFPQAARADQHKISLPLTNGRISAVELSTRLTHDLHLHASYIDRISSGAFIDVRGVSGWLALQGLNSALGDGFHISVDDSALVIAFDTQKLPQDWNATAGAVRKFTQITAPEATARQNGHMGLTLPEKLDPAKSLVILIHGLDGNALSCRDLQDSLDADHHQTATFCYPAELPLAESAVLLQQNIKSLREKYPAIRIDLVTESMGGLIARQFVEGPQYTGGIDHLILIAPPNNGSDWTPLCFLQKVESNIAESKNMKDWSPTWMITQGLCEAGDDLKPGSKFLTELNALPRRDGVKYTIIAGDQPIHYRVEADMLQKSAHIIAGPVANWWGFRQTRAAMENKADSLRAKTAKSDGPVKVKQAMLAGVNDFVEVPADHLALYHTTNGKPPAAWPVVRDRLSQ